MFLISDGESDAGRVSNIALLQLFYSIRNSYDGSRSLRLDRSDIRFNI